MQAFWGPDNKCMVHSCCINIYFFLSFNGHKSGPNVWWHKSVLNVLHCLKVFIWGGVVLVPCLLTLTVWAVIMSLRFPRHSLHKAIKVSLTPTLMWPCAPVASPLPILARWQSAIIAKLISSVLPQENDRQSGTHMHTHHTGTFKTTFLADLPVGQLTCWVLRRCSLLLPNIIRTQTINMGLRSLH